MALALGEAVGEAERCTEPEAAATEAVAAAFVDVGEALGARTEAEPLALSETEGVPLREKLAEPEALAQALDEGERAALREVEGVVVSVALARGEALRLRVGEPLRHADSECDSVTVAVGDAVVEPDCDGERVMETGGVRECEALALPEGERELTSEAEAAEPLASTEAEADTEALLLADAQGEGRALFEGGAEGQLDSVCESDTLGDLLA